MTTETPLDTIGDALCRTADAARCWEINPCIDNDRYLTQLVEQAQEAIARAYPPTETTLRQLQHIAPDGLNLALIRCAATGSLRRLRTTTSVARTAPALDSAGPY